MSAILGTLGGKIGGVLLLVVLLGGGYAWITTSAYNRGVAARDAQAREVINRMEARLKEALKKNETLTDDELDCALRRLRDPTAPCR